MRTVLSSLAALCLLALPAAAARPAPPDAAAGENAEVPKDDLGLDMEGGEYSLFRYSYTPLELDKCEVMDKSDPEEEGPGWVHWRCKGLTEDWPVHVFGGDPSYTVSYGENASDEPAMLQGVGHFNSLHSTLEWVTAGEDPENLKPVATILRYFVHLAGGTERARKHPVLVVTQLKPGAVCHVAYVDARANENANRDAREAAARLAGSYNCEAEPELVGPQTPGIFAE